MGVLSSKYVVQQQSGKKADNRPEASEYSDIHDEHRSRRNESGSTHRKESDNKIRAT